MKHILVLAIALAAGCSFNPGKDDSDMSGGGGAGGGDDMSGGGDDMASADMTMICTPNAKTCAAGMLSTCNSDGTGIDTSTCSLGCNAANNGCAALQPTAPAVAGDFVYGGLSELMIGATQTLLVFDTDTGEIRDNAGTVVRMPNATPMSRNVENGIGFHNTSGVGIWTFSKLTVPSTTTIVFKHTTSAASILSASDLTIAGTIDARGYGDPTMAATRCADTAAGPGGTIGGTAAQVALGTGAGGGATDTSTGAGGGGYGDVGGSGGKNPPGMIFGAGGAMAGAAAINPLAGGFGGGASGGNGGGGGGALQLAAQGALTISGKLNAGGCGGNPGTATAMGGGGGGSGGAIVVEAPTVHVTAAGIMAANGGGGGSGGNATAAKGDPGDASASQASGGAGAGAHAGGLGGALGATAGTTGGTGNGAGGGGGGVGRIRVNTRTGTATIDGTMVSPAASQGTAVIQ